MIKITLFDPFYPVVPFYTPCTGKVGANVDLIMIKVEKHLNCGYLF